MSTPREWEQRFLNEYCDVVFKGPNEYLSVYADPGKVLVFIRTVEDKARAEERVWMLKWMREKVPLGEAMTNYDSATWDDYHYALCEKLEKLSDIITALNEKETN